MNFVTRTWLGILVLLLLAACGERADTGRVHIDLPDIRERGRLVAITAYSQTGYFIYRGEPMGYEYELLQRLAEHLDLDLDIVVADNLDQLTDDLLNGRGDLIAYNLTITNERKRRVAFTDPHSVTRQVLVQRRPGNWRQMKRHEIDAALIRNPIDLEGKTVHVRRGSSYYERLTNLENEIGGEIEIRTVPGDITTEELIRRVADGEIDFTVADENLAAIHRTTYPDLDIGTRISMPQRIGWAVRRNSPRLLEEINRWLAGMKQSSEYNVIYNKYFKNRQSFRRRLRSPYISYGGGRLSLWDDMIRAHAAQLDWDWRLLASLIYQESEFDSTAESWAGASGLMQMMPAVAVKFGLTDPSNPGQSLAAGTAYLRYLQDLYPEITDPAERQKFVLASYNAGENHIADARRLTEKFGGNPNRWDEVARYLLLKSDPAFYTDPVVRYGYCRGEEPLKYVTEILSRYQHYRQLIPAN